MQQSAVMGAVTVVLQWFDPVTGTYVSYPQGATANPNTSVRIWVTGASFFTSSIEVVVFYYPPEGGEFEVLRENVGTGILSGNAFIDWNTYQLSQGQYQIRVRAQAFGTSYATFDFFVASLQSPVPEPPVGGSPAPTAPPDETLIATGRTVAEFQASIAAGAVMQEGQKGRVMLQGPGIGYLGDTAGMEQLWGSHLVPAGAVVDDVEGVGSSTVIVRFHIPAALGQGAQVALGPVALIGIALAIGAAVAALAWLVNSITLFIETLGPVGKAVVGGFGILLLVMAVAAVLGGGKRNGKG